MEVKLVLWGQRAIEFGAELVFDKGHNTPVVGVFVGVIMESYNNDETLSGGAACRWYLNEEIPEIDSYFERLGNNFSKVQWISIGTEKFAASRNRGDLPHKTVVELRELDPWETEATDFLCTVTIANVAPEQPWWFQSRSKCHRSATSYGSEYKCSGGCVSTKAYPKYRLCLIGTDGTGSAEFVFFNRVAQQLVGKTVMSLLRSSGLPREIVAIVCQKYTLAVNAIETFFGRQDFVTHETRIPAILPISTAASSSLDDILADQTENTLPVTIPEPPMPTEDVPKKQPLIRTPLRDLKRKKPETAASEKDFEGVTGTITPNKSLDNSATCAVNLGRELAPEIEGSSLQNKDGEVVVQDAPKNDHIKISDDFSSAQSKTMLSAFLSSL